MQGTRMFRHTSGIFTFLSLTALDSSSFVTTHAPIAIAVAITHGSANERPFELSDNV